MPRLARDRADTPGRLTPRWATRAYETPGQCRTLEKKRDVFERREHGTDACRCCVDCASRAIMDAEPNRAARQMALPACVGPSDHSKGGTRVSGSPARARRQFSRDSTLSNRVHFNGQRQHAARQAAVNPFRPDCDRRFVLAAHRMKMWHAVLTEEQAACGCEGIRPS